MNKFTIKNQEVLYQVKTDIEVPIMHGGHEEPIVYYYYLETNQTVEENYLLEKHRIRYLDVYKFLNKARAEKMSSQRHSNFRLGPRMDMMTDTSSETINIEIFDDVLLFGNQTTYASLASTNKLSEYYKAIMEISLPLENFSKNIMLYSQSQLLKRFIHVYKCLCNPINPYGNEFKEIFETVCKLK